MAFGQILFGCLAVSTLCSAYAVYGPKRYRAYSPIPVFSARTPRPYAPYYDPYTPDVNEVVDLYPQDPYDRYRYYQVPPYYIPDATPYYYDDEEIPDEEEEKEDPYNQDWYYQDGNAKANAYFLQNLILAQMYKDAQAAQAQAQTQSQTQTQSRHPVTYAYPREDYDDYVYGEMKEPNGDDSDVSQLKSLVKDSPKRQQVKNKFQEAKARFADNNWSEQKRSSNDKKGQDEMVMPRPATPMRTPVFHQRAHEPSAYDAIKKLLHVQSQKKSSGNRQPQKRSYIPNEDALVEQLGNLKKSA